MPAEPISSANKAAFEAIRDRVVAELEGSEEIAGGVITEQDIIPAAKSE